MKIAIDCFEYMQITHKEEKIGNADKELVHQHDTIKRNPATNQIILYENKNLIPRRTVVTLGQIQQKKTW